MARFVEFVSARAQHAQRDVEASGQAVVGVFVLKANVQPARAVGDPLLSLDTVHHGQQRRFDQTREVGLGQTRQLAGGGHAHRGVTARPGNQCFLAKGVAGTEFC